MRLFIKFIEEDIDPKDDKIIEPTKKLIRRLYNLSIDKLIKIDATGIEIKKGICTKIKFEIVLSITINSKLKPLRCKITKLPVW